MSRTMPMHRPIEPPRRHNDYLLALHHTTLDVMQCLNRDEVLETIVERAGALVETAHGFLYLVDDNDGLTLQAGTGVFKTYLGRRLEYGVGLSGKVWQTKQPLVINNYGAWSERAPGYESVHFHATAAVPLMVGSALIGVLGLGYVDADQTFDDDTILLLSQFAQLASVALDNARLYGASQHELAERIRAERALRESEARYRALLAAAERQTQEMTLLDRVRTALARELDLHVVFHTVVEAIADTFGYTQVSLYMVEGDALVMQHQVGYPQFITHLPLARGVMGRVVRTGIPALIEAGQTDPDAVWAFEGLASEVCVPLSDQNRVVGVLNLETTDGVSLGEADLRLMEALSEHVNIAIGRARLYTALRDGQRRYQTVVNNVKEVIYQIDQQGCWTFLNPAWTDIIGYGVDESLGTHCADYVHPDDCKTYMRAFIRLIKSADGEFQHEVRYLARDGGVRWLATYGRATLDDHGVVNGVSGTLTDITERKQAEWALRKSEARFRAIFEGAAIGTGIIDATGRLVETNAAFQTMLGYSGGEMEQMSLGQFTYPDDTALNINLHGEMFAGQRDSYQLEKRYLRKDGSVVWGRVTVSLIRDLEGDSQFAVGMIEDITERKQAEANVTRMAYYDALTNLPNRVLFRTQLEQAIGRAEGNGEHVALLFLDLDRFKVINDTLGHHVGDLLLQAVAQRLQHCVRDSDTVARMGGDEFTVILGSLADPQLASEVAQRIITELSAPYSLEGHELVITPSIGISIYPGDGGDVDTLLKQADIAMYRAKGQAGNTWRCFTPTMNVRVQEQLELEQQLRRALEHDEFVVYYQPRADLRTGNVTGMEALVRWQHPQRGLVLPNQFIPLLEETGLITALGEWVLRVACIQAKAWQDMGGPLLRIAVNLSARQLHQTDVVDRVVQVLTDTGLAPHYLELEITEGSAIQNIDHTIQVLRAVKHLGIHVSLDDFGTGYSSLSYLKQFPLDTLKLDQSFVRNLVTNPQDAAIAEAVITLAHNLELTVTAEGVETEAQRQFLQARHCDEIQGFLLGKPTPADVFAQMVLGIRG